MKPVFDRTTRRQFLRGAGGAVLALPLLPSLLPRDVEAQAVAQMSNERYFVHMTTNHALFAESYYGPLLTATPTATMTHGGLAVRSAPLPWTTQGDMTVISDVIRARTTALTPRMRGLINVINGLDFARSIGHNRGWPLGGTEDMPSIDQTIAASTAFYPTPVLQPVIVRNEVSRSRSGSGVVRTPESAESNTKLFDRLFRTTTGTPGAIPDSVVVVDRVREHANLVLRDPSCSADCRSRLTDYLDLLAQAERGLQTSVASSFQRPTTDTLAFEREAGFYGAPARHAQAEQLWNDIVVAAFSAGISRLYVCGPVEYTFGPEPNHSWHNIYAHGQDDAQIRAGFAAAVQLQFEGALLDIATKLDAVRTADGRTLLDKAIVAKSFEMGSGGHPGHHHNRCIPIVSIGNAGGYFRTGLSVDYRDLTSFAWSSNPRWYKGLLYDQWLGMVIRAMGVPSSHFDSTRYGYPGVAVIDSTHTDVNWSVAGQDLPWLRA